MVADRVAVMTVPSSDTAAPSVAATADRQYATAAQFRARNASSSHTDDQLLDELLAAASWYLDERCGVCPGGFAPISETAVKFWPVRAGRVLWLRDTSGDMWPLRAVTSVAVDYAGDGVPDWTVDGTAGWVSLEPPPTVYRSASSLRIEEAQSAVVGWWPSDPGTVTVTGLWGVPWVPPPVRELVVHLARVALDSHLGGAAAMLGAMDGEAVAVDGEGGRLWRSIESRYGFGRPSRFGLVSGRAQTDWRH